MAEGHLPGFSYEIQKVLEQKHLLQSHVCVLGHIQRGGIPSATDRFIASQMGYCAVKGILEGQTEKVTACRCGKVLLVPFEDCLGKKKGVDSKLLDLAARLSI